MQTSMMAVRLLICELRGSGDITLSGVVSRFSKHETGSGDVNVGELQMLK